MKKILIIIIAIIIAVPLNHSSFHFSGSRQPQQGYALRPVSARQASLADASNAAFLKIPGTGRKGHNNVLPRGKFSPEIQREAHLIFHAYRYGDMRVFGALCRKNGIDPNYFHRSIEEESKKHIINAIVGFKPDIIITDTHETDVQMGASKAIVIKTSKGEYIKFIKDLILNDSDGARYLNELANSFPNHRGYVFVNADSDVFEQKKFKRHVNYLFERFKKFQQSKNIISDNKKRVVADIVSDYAQQLLVLNTYRYAQNCMGGLVAEFAIIDNDIYQERVTPLTEYLLDLADGRGIFSDLGNGYTGKKLNIAKDVFRKCLECALEAAKRGLLIGDLKLTNFGIKSTGGVVLFDLGPATFSAKNEQGMALAFGNLGINMFRIINLGMSETTGGKLEHVFSNSEAAEKLKHEWARIWIELTSNRRLGTGEKIKWDFEKDGQEFIDKIKAVFPATNSEAKRKYRRITFVASEIAAEDILQIIMQHIEKLQNKHSAIFSTIDKRGKDLEFKKFNSDAVRLWGVFGRQHYRDIESCKAVNDMKEKLVKNDYILYQGPDHVLKGAIVQLQSCLELHSSFDKMEAKIKIKEAVRHLSDNIRQHAHNSGILLAKFNKKKTRLFLAMMDNGDGFHTDSNDAPAIQLTEKRFLQRPGSPGIGAALKEVFDLSFDFAIYTRGYVWTKECPVVVKSKGIGAHKGAMVLVTVDFIMNSKTAHYYSTHRAKILTAMQGAA